MTSDLRTLPEIGYLFHWVRDGLTYSPDQSIPLSGVISITGRTMTVTPELIASTSDKNGDSWLALLGDEEAQVVRWGAVYMKPGPAPQSLVDHPWERGGAAEANERSRRVEEAFKLPTIRQREEALAAINKEFPRSTKPTSTLKYRHHDGEFA